MWGILRRIKSGVAVALGDAPICRTEYLRAQVRTFTLWAQGRTLVMNARQPMAMAPQSRTFTMRCRDRDAG